MRKRLLIAVAAMGLWSAPAFAQGCAMCYSNAAGASKDAQRAISKGVLEENTGNRYKSRLSLAINGLRATAKA